MPVDEALPVQRVNAHGKVLGPVFEPAALLALLAQLALAACVVCAYGQDANLLLKSKSARGSPLTQGRRRESRQC